jgi:XTP/dITP diphosphohydrolase
MSTPSWLNQGSLVLASNNKGKIAEFDHLFQQLNLPVEIIPQGKLNIEDAIEDGLSFVENAIIKARHASKLSGKPAIADDSGLCVPILGEHQAFTQRDMLANMVMMLPITKNFWLTSHLSAKTAK